jgi:hypothetical protein
MFVSVSFASWPCRAAAGRTPAPVAGEAALFPVAPARLVLIHNHDGRGLLSALPRNCQLLALSWHSPFTIAPKSGVKRPYFVVRKDKRAHLDSNLVANPFPSPPLEERTAQRGWCLGREHGGRIGIGAGIGVRPEWRLDKESCFQHVDLQHFIQIAGQPHL